MKKSGEACFKVSISKDSKRKSGWRIIPGFVIHLHKKDLSLLLRPPSPFSAELSLG
jgi:hypothetical protein